MEKQPSSNLLLRLRGQRLISAGLFAGAFLLSLIMMLLLLFWAPVCGQGPGTLLGLGTKEHMHAKMSQTCPHCNDSAQGEGSELTCCCQSTDETCSCKNHMAKTSTQEQGHQRHAHKRHSGHGCCCCDSGHAKETSEPARAETAASSDAALLQATEATKQTTEATASGAGTEATAESSAETPAQSMGDAASHIAHMATQETCTSCAHGHGHGHGPMPCYYSAKMLFFLALTSALVALLGWALSLLKWQQVKRLELLSSRDFTKLQGGLSVQGHFAALILVLNILVAVTPWWILGMCMSPHMMCRKVTFPLSTVLSVLLILLAVALYALARSGQKSLLREAFRYQEEATHEVQA